MLHVLRAAIHPLAVAEVDPARVNIVRCLAVALIAGAFGRQ